MTARRFFILLLALVTLLSFASCANNAANANKDDPNNPLDGEWRENTTDGFGMNYTFNKDNTGVRMVLDIPAIFTYTYDEDTVYIEIVDPPVKKELKYKVEGNQLTLTFDEADGPIDRFFTKQ